MKLIGRGYQNESKFKKYIDLCEISVVIKRHQFIITMHIIMPIFLCTQSPQSHQLIDRESELQLQYFS